MKDERDATDALFGAQALEEKLNADLLDSEEESTEQDNIDSMEGVEEAVQGVEEEQVQEAKKHGYLTKDEYLKKHGTLDGFKSPDEFNKYGKAWDDVKDVITGMKKSLEERDKQLEALVKYNERVEERALQRARAQLEEQLRLARDQGDVDAVEHLTREKAKVEFQTSQDLIQKQEVERMQAARDFMEKNKHWYNVNPIMTSRVNAIDAEERHKAQANNIPLTYTQLANIVEARMRLEFPEVMLAPNAGNTAPNLSMSRSAVNKQSISGGTDIDKAFRSLHPEHIAVFKATNNMLKRQGRTGYTEKEFIEKLRKDGEI